MNTRASEEELAYILEDSGARFLLVDASLHPLVEDLESTTSRRSSSQDTGEPDDPYEEFLASGSPDPIEMPIRSEDEPISINYTSGTTGSPRARSTRIAAPTCARSASRWRPS